MKERTERRTMQVGLRCIPVAGQVPLSLLAG